MNPRDGFPIDGVCNAWNTFMGDERIDATSLTMMTDCIPSMSNTLLRSGGLYDARGRRKILAAKSSLFDSTVTMDIEFKRRLSDNGVKWIFTRAVTEMLDVGRVDLSVTICDEKMVPLCLSRQVVLAVDFQRRFKNKKTQAAL
ncbi:putative Thioesterase domain-containing protein [Seiridium cardinale]